MEKEKNVIALALKKGLNINKGDSVFVSLSSKEKHLENYFNEILKNYKITDVFFNYYDITADKKKWGEYLSKDARFLIIVNDDFKNTFAALITSGFLREEIDITYTIIPDPKILLGCKNIDENWINEFNFELKGIEKIYSKIKSFKLKTLSVKTFDEVNLFMEFENKYRLPNEYKKMNRYPNDMLEMIPKIETVNGYVDASKTTYIDLIKVENLRLTIKNGYVIDFDYQNPKNELEKETLKKLLTPNNFFYVDAVGLISETSKFFNYQNSFENLVLDRTSNPYILIKSKENDKIYVPIDYKTLIVNGVSQAGNTINLYNLLEYSDKVIPNGKTYIKNK